MVDNEIKVGIKILNGKAVLYRSIDDKVLPVEDNTIDKIKLDEITQLKRQIEILKGNISRLKNIVRNGGQPLNDEIRKLNQ